MNQDDILKRYRQAANPAERSHWHIIRLLAQDKRVSQVAQLSGYSASWIRELARRYNAVGPKGLDDRRKTIAGAKPLLDAPLQAELDPVLQSPPKDGGLWNGRKVADWIATRTGRKVHRQRGWAWLGRMDYTLQQPRSHHATADPEEEQQFKKTR